MSETEVQISAYISQATKELLERHTRATGVKKAFVVEMALRHHLQALRELPADVVIPPRLVISKQSGDSLLKSIEKPPAATQAMRELMGGG